ncbi:MAG: inorganic phosphate transporter, partial [Candidatus Muiribacteriota bacterium]
GIPISTSQAVVGAVIGIGLVKGAKTISFGKIFQIIMGWFLTPFVCRNFFAWNFLFAENIRIQCDIIKKQLLFINMNKLLLKHSLTKLLFTM